MSLRSGGTVRYFRVDSTLERVWPLLLRELAYDWEITSDGAAGDIRTISGCRPDCDGQRYYLVARRTGLESVEVVLRRTDPREFGSPDLPRTGCRPIEPPKTLPPEGASWHRPIVDLDLDRDGQLDLVVPKDGPGGVVWEPWVRRDACGVRLAALPGAPRWDHVSAVGPDGMIDLRLFSRSTDRTPGSARRTTVRYRRRRYEVIEGAGGR